jgi:hypothetical protein
MTPKGATTIATENISGGFHKYNLKNSTCSFLATYVFIFPLEVNYCLYCVQLLLLTQLYG